MGPKAHERLFQDCGTDNRPATIIERRARTTNTLAKLGIEIETIETLARKVVR